MDFVVFIGLSVLALGVALPFLMLHQSRLSPAAILRRRVEALAPSVRAGSEGVDARARQQLIQHRLKELERQRNRRRNTLSHLILQSGLSLSVPGYFGLCAASGGAVALLLLVFKMAPPVILVGAAAGGIGLPRLVLVRIVKGRQRQFTSYFAEALDILVRGARTGLPVGECLRIVAREVPDPVGFEFRMLVDAQRLGMTTEQALERGLQRMPTAEFQFFAVVLVIQQQTGGNLAQTLENLSNVLRARKRIRDKVAAMSSEAKSSAMIIGSLPFLIAGVIYLINPAYMSLLFTTNLGMTIVGGGLFWMALGILVMHQMINFKI
jgi:tight adherence protein B